MRRWVAILSGVFVLAAFLASSSVGVQAATKTVSGTVAAVAPDSLTVKAKDGEHKLVVDSKTRIVGTGVGTKTAKMKEEKKTPQITDFVKAGDEVSAKYDDASNHASEVRLTKPAK